MYRMRVSFTGNATKMCDCGIFLNLIFERSTLQKFTHAFQAFSGFLNTAKISNDNLTAEALFIHSTVYMPYNGKTLSLQF